MIAKKVRRKKEAVKTSSFQRLAIYILDVKHQGAKVVATRVSNCVSEDPVWVIREVLETQSRNTRSKADKNYHLIVSFCEGDRPTPEALVDIENTMVAGLGFAGHQRLSVVHNDTPQLHLHIAISKVHPTTLRCVEPYYDYQRLDALCYELEQRHGLQAAPRIRDGWQGDVTPSPPGRAGDQEAHAGEETLLGWLRRDRAELEQARDRCSTWEQFHQVLAERGLELHQRGAGVSLRARDTGYAVKPSQVSRTLSNRALIERFGAYEAPVAAVVPAAKKKYDHRPLERGPLAGKLYTQYQEHRAAALAARQVQREEQRAKAAEHAAELRKWYAERRKAIRDSPRTAKEKRFEYRRLGEQRREDRAKRTLAASSARVEISKAHPLPTWREFLRDEAEHGDVAALEVLRARQRRTRAIATALLTAEDVDSAAHVVLQGVKSHTERDGTVVYHLADGGQVSDERHQVRVDELTAGAVFAALSLASQRFVGQALIIEGSAEFKDQIGKLVDLRGFDLKFAGDKPPPPRAGAVPETTKSPSIEAFIAQRNELRHRVSDIYYHRTWEVTDAGEAIYRGHRHLTDGSEVVLLERGGNMLVMAVTNAQAAKASMWQVGTTVLLDERQRFRNSSDRSDEREEGRGRE